MTRFDGSDYSPTFDDARLTGQLRRVVRVMRDQRWRTLVEIADATGDPESSISAQLRHLRKERFGAHTVNKRPRGEREIGLFEYQLIINEKGTVTPKRTPREFYIICIKEDKGLRRIVRDTDADVKEQLEKYPHADVLRVREILPP